MTGFYHKAKFVVGLAILLPMFAVSCSKKANETKENAAVESSNVNTTAEQQAAIDSLQKPNPEAVKAEDASATSETSPEAGSEAVAK